VGIGDRVRNPVDVAAAKAGLKRAVAARVPTFSAVPPLLARSDLLATLPAVVLSDALERFGLAARPVPFRIDPMPHVLLSNAYGQDSRRNDTPRIPDWRTERGKGL
jgi:hypothetical protein